METEAASSKPAKMAKYQRSISDTDVQIGAGDPLSMKRQLQISFANLEESENAFQVKVKYMEIESSVYQ